MQQVQTLLSQQSKKFSIVFIAILISTKNFADFKRKDQLHSFNISKVIVPEKCGNFNSRMPLFYNTLPESKYSRVPNTAETCTAALLSQFSINLRQIESENMFLSQI